MVGVKPQTIPPTERRTGMLRRDLNDLVRDESGRLSPTKVGTLLGQWLAIKLILENGSALIVTWDSLMILFSVLIAPELFRKLMNMKYGGPTTGTTTTTTDTSTQTKTSKATK